MKITLMFFLFLRTTFSDEVQRLSSLAIQKVEYDFILLHNSAFSGHLGEVNIYNGVCSDFSARIGGCFGGLSRIGAILEDLRRKAELGGPEVLYVFAGGIFNSKITYDFHDSSVWYEVLNKLKPNIVVPTYPELNYGRETFDNLFTRLNEKPILTNGNQAANINLNVVFPKHRLVEVRGKKILLLGILCEPKIKGDWSKNLKLLPIIESINNEIEQVSKTVNVSLTIVAAHCDCGMSEIIARECPYVTIVVEGGCEKLFYNGLKPPKDLSETIQSKYPLVVEKLVEGRIKRALVVNSFLYGKYTGKLYVKLKAGSGDLDQFHGNSLLMDHTFKKDPVIENLYQKALKVFHDKKLFAGYSRVKLDPDDCLKGECAFGNFVTDAIIFGRSLELHQTLSFPFYSDSYQSFILSDLFRKAHFTTKTGAIQNSELLKAIPRTRYIVVEVHGFTLKNAIQKLAVSEQQGKGGILQMSGVKARIDRNGIETDIKLLFGSRGYVPLKEYDVYSVLIDERLYNGSSSEIFDFVDENVNRPILCTQTSKQIFSKYLEFHNLLYPIVGQDITFFTSRGCLFYDFTFIFNLFILKYII
ncbi:hypothetical protein ACFFRR_007742 [Megaselia abdita]